MKILALPFLAANLPIDGLPTTQPQVGGMRIADMLIVLVPVSVIMLGLVLWAIFIRKPRNEHARTRIYKSQTDVEELDDGTIRKKKRHKRRRREHRSRNPTLAEAGGLPPMKSPEEKAKALVEAPKMANSGKTPTPLS